MDCRTALLTVLDQVDYTNGACGVTEMVGAVLPKEVIALARKAIADEAAQQSAQRTGLPTRTELSNAYADALLAKKRAKTASR
jgi:hypothetical protein